MDDKKEELILEWFRILLNGKENKTVLLLEPIANRLQHDIERSFKNFNIHESKYKIFDFDKFKKNINYGKKINNHINTIVFLPDKIDFDSNFEEFKRLFSNSYLYISEESDFYSNIEKYIKKNYSNHIHNIIPKEKKYLYYIESIDPIDLILKRVDEILDFINFTKKNLIFWKDIQTSSFLLCDKINYNTYNHEEEIESDISLLKVTNILTSRLSVVIYRLSTLNLKANVTEIGRYYHTKLESKSRTLNYKLIEKYKTLDNVTFDSNLLYKNFKGYDLDINETEIATRKEIALNLLNLDDNNLTYETISKVTKLSIEQIKKIQQ